MNLGGVIMKNRIINWISLTLNGILLILCIVSLSLLCVDYGAISLTYFTTISSILASIISIWGIIKAVFELKNKTIKLNEVFNVIKLMIVTSCLMSIFATLVFVGPKDLIEKDFLILRLIVPVIILIEYCICNLEPKVKFKYTFFTMIPFGIYLIIIGSLIANNIIDAPYAYIDVSTNIWYVNLTLIVMSFAGIYLIGLLSWFLNKLMYLILVGYDYVEQEDDGTSSLSETQTIQAIKDVEEFIKNEGIQEEETPIDNVEKQNDLIDKSIKQQVKNSTNVSDKKTTNNKKTAAKATKNKEKYVAMSEESVSTPKQYNQRVYHISRQKMVGKWQVKLATSNKVIKFFDTQYEAINFAKALVKTQGGSIRIHSVKGKMRKG